jgi:hypothetical protein
MAKVFFTFFVVALDGGEGTNGTNGTPTGGSTDTTSGVPPVANTLAILSGHYVTLREATPHHLTFAWKLGANTDMIKLTVRRNNIVVATRMLPATDSMCTVTGLSFRENDVMQAVVSVRTQFVRCHAKFKGNLQDNFAARSNSTNAVRPLATVESIHPRRRNQQHRTNTAPTAAGCAWVNNTDLNDCLYYKINDVGACVQAETTDSLDFYTCLDTHLAYFTFDTEVYVCGAANDDNSPNRIAKKPVVAKVFPNPFQHDLGIKCSLTQNVSFLTVHFSDIRGNLVYTHQGGATAIGEYIINIPTAELPLGVYFYTITGDGFSEKGRVIKID